MNLEKGRLLRRITVAGMLALTGCGITDGTVYQKEHTQTEIGVTDNGSYMHKVIDREAVSMPLSHNEERLDNETKALSEFLLGNNSRLFREEHRIYIAQCEKGKLLAQDVIEKECDINSSVVPTAVYNKIQIGQHVDLKRLK